ncbi:MAG: TatD family hydrolase [Deltaproteobacteria bacterium]|nr:TatD family hydrolase [Deltaproteobacteria bacterium]
MIDCHAHLAAADFDDDRPAVLERARAAGVEQVVVVGEDAAEARRVLEICATHGEMLRPCVGIHPDRFADDLPLPIDAELEAIETLARANHRHLAAIGEVGLDYWRVKDEERRAAQRGCLERMAALAAALDLPLNVHSRSAGHHTLSLLTGCGARRVLMHAFDGRASYAKRAAEEHGYFFSIPPSVVRSRQKQKLVRALPLEVLALESDSPVLGPEPGQRNEPANLTRTVTTIAELKGVSEEQVRETTTATARRLFGR